MLTNSRARSRASLANKIGKWRRLTVIVGALFCSLSPCSAFADKQLPMNGDCTYFSEVFRGHQREGKIPPRPTPQGFRAFLANDNNISVIDITSRISRKLLDQRQMRFQPFSYSEISDYYKLQLTMWQRLYPELSIRFQMGSVMGMFRGKILLSMSETFRIPFAPISADIDEPFDEYFYKLQGRYNGKPVLGMRSKFVLARAPKELCPQTLYLSYMPDINARMLGFSHGQLIPELSSNVMPAFAFEYNGLNHWDKHASLAERDQLTRPIPLTNFAHLGRTYVISGHPDFSLMLEDYEGPPARMTFFLWRPERQIATQKVDLEAVPDFVYQVDIEYRDAPRAR